MVSGLCPAGMEFYDFTKTSFELPRGCILNKYECQSLARLLGTIPDFNHREKSSSQRADLINLQEFILLYANHLFYLFHPNLFITLQKLAVVPLKQQSNKKC